MIEQRNSGTPMRPLRIALAFGVAASAIIVIWIFARPTRAHHGPWCANSLKAVSLALHNYQEDYGSFPPLIVRDSDGTPMHSWRALIFPYLESPTYGGYDFDQPWNSPSNLDFSQEVLGRNSCWYHSCLCQQRNQSGVTVVLAVVGPDTAWPEDHCVSLGDITDRHDSTAYLVAVSHSDISWFEPGDISVEELPKNSAHGDGVFVGLVDGTVKFLPSNERSRAFFTIAAGDLVSMNALKPAADYRN